MRSRRAFPSASQSRNGARPHGCGPISAWIRSTRVDAWADRRLRMEPGVLVRRMVHAALRAEHYDSKELRARLLSKMDATQHNRGWDLSIEKGMISVELVNEVPKEQPPDTKRAGKESRPDQGSLSLSNAGRSDGEGSCARASQTRSPTPRRKQKSPSEAKKPEPQMPPDDTTPRIAIKVTTRRSAGRRRPLAACVLYLRWLRQGLGHQDLCGWSAGCDHAWFTTRWARRRSAHRRRCNWAMRYPDANPRGTRATRTFACMRAR